jgi:hypothetical protein
MSSTSELSRAVVAFASAALIAAGVTFGQEQEQPFRVQTPFGAGETWQLRSEVTTLELPVDEGEDRAEVNTLTWTESAQVEARPIGFGLRSTLTSFRIDSRAPYTESRVNYDDEDLRKIRIASGREEDFARTWTYELDPSWRLLGVSGQQETVQQLYERAMADMSTQEDGCGKALGRWLGRTVGPFVVERMSERLEEQLIRSNDEGLAPVRVVMERLRAAGTIEPGFAAKVEGAGEMPGGTVRFVGVGEGGAQFEVELDVQQATEQPVAEYSFVIDDAGRLTRVDTMTTNVAKQGGRDVRVTTRFAYTLEQVTPASGRPEQPGVDTGEQEPPRSRPF